MASPPRTASPAPATTTSAPPPIASTSAPASPGRSASNETIVVPTPPRTWHTLALELRATLSATLDGQKRFEKTLDFVPSGRVGLWSKADSQVLFDDFAVTPLPGTR
jgi:hypothetical protein